MEASAFTDEDAAPSGVAGSGEAASMEPSAFHRRRPRGHRSGREGQSRASMGPSAFTDGEDPSIRPKVPLKQPWLQWDRRLSPTEAWETRTRSATRSSCFNGAASFHRRRAGQCSGARHRWSAGFNGAAGFHRRRELAIFDKEFRGLAGRVASILGKGMRATDDLLSGTSRGLSVAVQSRDGSGPFGERERRGGVAQHLAARDSDQCDLFGCQRP